MAERHPGLEITTEQVDGRPLPVLETAAKEAEVLVLGARGLGTMTGFLVGSVSQAVLAHAERPVVVVRTVASPDRSYPAPDGSTPAGTRPGMPARWRSRRSGGPGRPALRSAVLVRSRRARHAAPGPTRRPRPSAWAACPRRNPLRPVPLLRSPPWAPCSRRSTPS
nr:universal stress protein [Streptomyces sp. XY332]